MAEENCGPPPNQKPAKKKRPLAVHSQPRKAHVESRARMPTMAMEPMGSMSSYRSFSSSGVSPSGRHESKAAREKRLALEAQQEEEEARRSLVARASTMAKIADIMSEQNEKMLAGLRANSTPTQRTGPAEKVDFVARNIADVDPGRSTISRKEQEKLAHAQVLAAATAHLPSTGASASRPRPRAQAAADPPDEDAILRAAREEIERGAQISAHERESRGPRNARVGVRKAFGPGGQP